MAERLTIISVAYAATATYDGQFRRQVSRVFLCICGIVGPGILGFQIALGEFSIILLSTSL